MAEQTQGQQAGVQQPQQQAQQQQPQQQQQPEQQTNTGVQQTTPQAPQAPQEQKPELPEGTSARTSEQFDKLLESNQRLQEANKILQSELARKAQAEQQFAPLQQQTQQQQPQVEQFVELDPVTGERYVNEEKLGTAIREANQRAEKAEKAVQDYVRYQQQQDEQRQTVEAYKAYPELNPQAENFDSGLHRRTRALLLDSMMNPGDYDNRTLTFKEAADLAREQNPKEATAVEQKVEEQVAQEEALKQKEQAGMAASGGAVNVNPAQQDADLESLRWRSRTGDLWAIAQRLQSVPHEGTPTSSKKGEGEE